MKKLIVKLYLRQPLTEGEDEFCMELKNEVEKKA